MPGEQGDSLPTPEIDAEAYQKVKRTIEQGGYTTLIGALDEAKPIVDRLMNELAQTHATMRVTVPERGKDFPGVLSEFIPLAPEAAKGAVREGFNTTFNFSMLMEKIAQVNEKPVLAIIENVQHVTYARDDLIRAIRALHEGRAREKDLEKLTFLLVADQHPSDLLEDTRLTPYNIGTNVYLQS